MSAVPSQPEYVSLYHRAFKEFGAMALGSTRQFPDPTPEDALAITRSLRVEGDLKARRLAVKGPIVRPFSMKQLFFKDPDGYELCLQWTV